MTLVDLYRLIVRGWKIVLASVLACAILAGLLAFGSTPVYRASAVLAPASRPAEATGLSAVAERLSGLALLAGLNVGSGIASSAAEAVAILQSRSFTSRFIEDLNLLPVLFADEWDAEQEAWKDEAPTLQDAYELFDEKIRSIREDRKTSMYVLSIDWRDRHQAAEWANVLVERLNDAARKVAIEQAQSQIKYLDAELEGTTVVGTREAISRLLENQIQSIMIASVNKDYAFRIIDPAVPPDVDRFAWPKRGVIIFAGIIMGLALGTFVAAGRLGAVA